MTTHWYVEEIGLFHPRWCLRDQDGEPLWERDGLRVVSFETCTEAQDEANELNAMEEIRHEQKPA